MLAGGTGSLNRWAEGPRGDVVAGIAYNRCDDRPGCQQDAKRDTCHDLLRLAPPRFREPGVPGVVDASHLHEKLCVHLQQFIRTSND
jgi:hypothetical protein